MKLIGQIERIIFESDGFFIALLSSGEKISGAYHESSVASIEHAAVTLEGEYAEHPKHGRTFRFHSLTVNQHELFFFLNRIVKRFPKKLTAELIEQFGEEGLVDILDNDIERLATFAGIKEKRLERIQSRWKQFRSMRGLGTLLAPFGVTPGMITTISGALKEVSDPAAAVKNNPYILANIQGIGFKRADELALKMGVDVRDDRRLACAMEYAVNQGCERNGNSCLEKAELFIELDRLLCDRSVRDDYETILVGQIEEGNLHLVSEHLLAPSRLYDAEKYIFDELRRRSKTNDEPLSGNLDTFLDQSDLSLGEEQRLAVETLNSGVNAMCLVGYAGTGKSTTSKTLLDLLALRHGRDQIMTCALSGIASQRIGEVSGYESATIQSLLVRFEDRDTMPYKVVLIDEASMINTVQFARLLRKCRRDATIIIVGDDAQLPPIGAGDVLADIIRFGLLPVVKLTKIYRQDEGKAIAVIADAVRRGKMPDLEAHYDDFHFLSLPAGTYPQRDAHAEAVLAALVGQALEAIPAARELLKEKALYAYLVTFQVITPMKGGVLGTRNLNRVLQGYFNPSPRRTVERGETPFALMDKVVHTKNDNLPSWTTQEFKENSPSETRRIFNGMLGLLFRIDEDEQQAYVVYPLESIVVRYEFAQLQSYLSLAYALTVHKVQGMEYADIVMPMSFSHTVMLDKKLLYTAITRAKAHCTLVGDAAAFAGALERTGANRRRTVMQYLAGEDGERN